MNSRSLLLVALLAGPLLASGDPALPRFFKENCVKCHGPEKQKGDVRLDHSLEKLFADREFLETVTRVLDAGDMPPDKAPQPKPAESAQAIEALKELLAARREPTIIKRLTRTEYTHTINDLFDVRFDLSEHLPPDHVEAGFDKFGEAHLMSPHQVMAYLKTARFVAERLLPDAKPEERTWDFDFRHFHGSGRGDFRDKDAFVLSTFYPWRSNLHFSKKPDAYDRFIIEQFGRYRFVLEAEAIRSEEDEVIGVNLGDPRYPTNFKRLGRVPLRHGSGGFMVELTLKAGDEISFTFESARRWTTGAKPKQYKQAQVRFTRAQITGPILEQWPTAAAKKILPESGMSPESLVDHIALLLTQRALPDDDRAGFVKIAKQAKVSGASEAAVARSILISLLTSPHFIYKSESPELTDIELAHRLSYFLWNSVPDDEALTAARSGALRNDSADQVERMLNDPKAERFLTDFTRQWLQLDIVEELGPDMRLFKNVKKLEVAAMAREGTEFFRHILTNDLSMELFIDSDFVMANDRLARFYGLPAVEGDAFIPVKLPADSERGGLVAQAGFLKLTSGAFATSPIRRGAWILKNLYNEKIDPPADLVIEEPDIRGAKSIKEAIAKHQATESCFRCHSKIDPLGFALEYYDPVGLPRDEYKVVKVVSKTKLEITKQPIDARMKLADGRELSDMKSLKRVMLEDKEQILEGVIGKLISYALGRETTLADSPYINDVYQSIAANDHSLRAAIHAIVAHPEFGRK